MEPASQLVASFLCLLKRVLSETKSIENLVCVYCKCEQGHSMIMRSPEQIRNKYLLDKENILLFYSAWNNGISPLFQEK